MHLEFRARISTGGAQRAQIALATLLLAAPAWTADAKSDKRPADDYRGGTFWTEGSGQKPVVLQGMPKGFADLAEAASTGVVSIKTERTVNAQVPDLEEIFPPQFRSPFHDFFPRGPQPVASLGSGFVISNDGFIVTNNHVIADADKDVVDKIEVVFHDGTSAQATVVGRDPKTDIALIKIEAKKRIQALPLGDSDSVRPGDWVVAIGNPYGLEHTVTAGIVSAQHRNIGMTTYDDFIQTDAAINPGNSGGPLLNLAGEVVGINTAINQSANTIGFAVPVKMVKDILPQLRMAGRVTRGWLGVVIQRADDPQLEGLIDSADGKGALVAEVLPKSPAASAGIQRYDVIVEFAGKPIEEMDQLPRAVAATPIGRKVEVVVLRNGKKKELEVDIGELPDEGAPVASQESAQPDAFGLRVQKVTPEIADQLGVESTEGVVVTSVEPGSPAAEAGLQRGDVILELKPPGGKPVPIEDPDQLERALASIEAKALVLVRRGGSTQFLPLKRK
jgi:serine protease Do